MTSKIDVDLDFSQHKNRFASFLEADLDFSQYKNRSAFFLDVDLNFFQTEKDLHLYELQI